MISRKPTEFLHAVSQNRHRIPEQAIEEINTNIYKCVVFPTGLAAICGYLVYRGFIKKHFLESRFRRMTVGFLSIVLAGAFGSLAGVPFLDSSFREINKKYDLNIYDN